MLQTFCTDSASHSPRFPPPYAKTFRKHIPDNRLRQIDIRTPEMFPIYIKE